MIQKKILPGAGEGLIDSQKYCPTQIGRGKGRTPEQVCSEFLNRIKARFANDIRVYHDLLEVLVSYFDGRLTEGTVYRRFCRHLYGHVDLVLQLESLLNKDDSEETRGKIINFRTLAKKYYLEKRYTSAMETLTEGLEVEEMTEDDRTCIEDILYGDEYDSERHFGDDELIQRINKVIRERLTKSLEEDYQGVCNKVLPKLEKKLKDLDQGVRPVEEVFFDQILARPVPFPAI